MYKLFLVDNEQDVIVVSEESCVKYYNLVNCPILCIYNTTETIAKEIVTNSRQRPISFKCRRLCIPSEQIIEGSSDHFIQIARETTRYSDLHWVICRQVQRRRNKRWMLLHEECLLTIATWCYEYFDEYIKDDVDLMKHKFAVNFQEENKPNHTRKIVYTK